jgi:amidophosphoribosyltransferase
MDFPSKEELIANHHDSEESIGRELGVDSLRYLSVQGMMDSVPHEPGVGYCTACFTGEYPVEIDIYADKEITED